jgi:hypothetical protein
MPMGANGRQLQTDVRGYYVVGLCDVGKSWLACACRSRFKALQWLSVLTEQHTPERDGAGPPHRFVRLRASITAAPSEPLPPVACIWPACRLNSFMTCKIC